MPHRRFELHAYFGLDYVCDFLVVNLSGYPLADEPFIDRHAAHAKILCNFTYRNVLINAEATQLNAGASTIGYLVSMDDS